MVLIDDVVIGLSAAVATCSLIILLSFLSKYRTAASQASKSAELAKNIYDSMNSRFVTQDMRIVDLMARFEVLSTREHPGVISDPEKKVTISHESISHTSQEVPQIYQPSIPEAHISLTNQSGKLTNDTELTILRTLMEGPKPPNEIREVIQVTREHNGRLLKELYDRGLVTRNTEHKPFVYEITEAGRRSLT